MKHQSVLFGVTGIGLGHTFRQLPLIEHFAETGTVVVFAYDLSLAYLSERFSGHPRVTVIPVAVPFYVGNGKGLDFAATWSMPCNHGVDFLGINMRAMAAARRAVGTPTLVVSDYEPVSAQYAYATDAPLVTIDQQSKYLCGDFPPSLAGFTFADEVERLHMFFPRADARLAVSFFAVARRDGGDEVTIMPPVIKPQVLSIVRAPAREKEVIVYISSAHGFPQSITSVVGELAAVPDARFRLFVPNGTQIPDAPPNVSVFRHGNPAFDEALTACHGIVTTAGHSLLSEAMYLGIPVYAIPVSPYEQHMNAAVIANGGFGVSEPAISRKPVSRFLDTIDGYAHAIRDDRHILMRGVGQEAIVAFLRGRFGVR